MYSRPTRIGTIHDSYRLNPNLNVDLIKVFVNDLCFDTSWRCYIIDCITFGVKYLEIADGNFVTINLRFENNFNFLNMFFFEIENDKFGIFFETKF